MAKIALFSAFLLAALLYFLKTENVSIRNHLLCSFSSSNLDLMAKNKFIKLRQLLPEKYPTKVYTKLTQNVTALPQKFECDLARANDFRNSFLFSVREGFYSIYPDSLKTLDQVESTLHEERNLLRQLGTLKNTLSVENLKFATFTEDCLLIQNLVQQIKLLESHLKIDRLKRQPTQVIKLINKTKNVELRMIKNISRQLNFAKRHLESNERLFLVKWKNYFDFDSDKSLCPL